MKLIMAEVFNSWQGEGGSVEGSAFGRRQIFVRFAGCDLHCEWCFGKGTKVLMADLTWRSIETIKPGELVMGYNEETNKLYPVRVLETFKRPSEVVRVKFESGKSLKVTPNHKFYYYGERKRAIKDLLGKNVRTIGTTFVFNPNPSFIRGWLAGIVDGDGTIWSLKNGSRRIRIAMKDRDVLERFKQWANEMGYSFYWLGHKHTSITGKREVMPALYLTRTDEVYRFEREILHPSKIDRFYMRGYIAGMIDAEGTVESVVRISQETPEKKARIIGYLERLGYEYVDEGRTIRLKGKRVMALLLELKWQMERKRRIALDRWVRGRDRVVDIIDIGEDWVYNIKTESGNYIVSGYLVKNCDSAGFINASKVSQWRYEVEPFTGKFEYKPNPASVDEVIDAILRLDTGDIHSISYTGGEPTLQVRPLKALMERMHELGFSNFLETHGGLPELIKEVAHLTDYASVDIKDETAKATEDWKALVLREVESIRILKDAGAKTYAKLVVTKDTKIENVRWYASLLKGLAPLVIQPREPIDISQPKLMEFYREAALIMGRKNVGLSFQVHKYLNVL